MNDNNMNINVLSQNITGLMHILKQLDETIRTIGGNMDNGVVQAVEALKAGNIVAENKESSNFAMLQLYQEQTAKYSEIKSALTNGYVKNSEFITYQDETSEKFTQNDEKIDTLQRKLSGLYSDGALKYESDDAVASGLVSDITSKIQYFACLNMVFLRIRVQVAETLSADTSNVLAIYSSHTPCDNTPVVVCGGKTMSGYVNSAGEIIVNCKEQIEADEYIYISGFYYADFESTEDDSNVN